MDKEQVILTAYCLAYNHEKYIGKTLEGFVNQRTSYRYKVIVHDDASTDGTAAIIKEYADKYPETIVPVFQKENQYSRHVNIFESFIKPLLEGKYIAACEGDDYWCDPEKLQRQIDFMESHPDFSACVHNTEKITEDGSPTGKFYNKSQVDHELPADETIRYSSHFIHLNSVVYRREYRENKPAEFSMPKVGDSPLIIYLATVGRIWYMAPVMSKYRVFSSGSWTKAMNENKNLKIEHSKNAALVYEKMNEYTGYKYKRSFGYLINYSKARTAIYEKRYSEILLHPSYWMIFIKKIISKISGR